MIKPIFSKQTMKFIALFLIALLSIFVVSRIVAAPSFNAAIMKSLDDKKIIVMRLAATAVASSTALSLLPFDAAQPIANQLAELSSYFIVVLGAILLEKMLMTVVGYVTFTAIIPFACVLFASYLFTKDVLLRDLAIKLTLFGLVLFLAIPISIRVSDLMQASYQTSIEQTVETAKQNNDYIEEKKTELSLEDGNWISKVSDYLNDFTSKIGKGITDMVKKAENTLMTFIETIAVLLITTCVIPLLVILLLSWIVKFLFGFDIKGVVPKKPVKIKNAEMVSSQSDV